MANSRTLLVYVLALVVFGGRGSFWVTASTVPIVKDPLSATSSQLPHHQLQHNQKQVQLQHQVAQPLQHQQPQETSVVPSSAPSSAPVRSQPSTQSASPTMTVKNAWGLNAGTSRSGPYTSGYSYISGRTLNGPHSYMTDYDIVEQPSGYRTSNILNGMASGLNGMFGETFSWKSAAFGGLLTLAANWIDLPGSIGSLFPTTTPTTTKSLPTTDISEKTVSKKVDEISAEISKKETTATVADVPTVEPPKAEKRVAEAPAPAPASQAETPKSRQKRSAEPDTDLTELAAMVLATIRSGECMQKSICLLGSQIGGSDKGRLAFTMMDKLVPFSVQENTYFLTLKKALRGGEGFCDKFRCKL